jgi:tetratricopeptide (TPR) repeat protein
MNTYHRLASLLIIFILLHFCNTVDARQIEPGMDSIRAQLAQYFMNEPFNGQQAEIDLMQRLPDAADSQFYRSNYHLLRTGPTKENHNDYYRLGLTLWELDQLQDAEKIFLKILASKAPWYNFEKYKAAEGLYPGFPDDNFYKNQSCNYLAQIYIEQKKFKKALHYIGLAEKTYTYNGRGYPASVIHEGRYRYYYARCYEGLGMKKELLDLLLPHCLDNNYGMLTRAIKEMYTQEQIQMNLTEAENSITCQTDSFLSYTNVSTPKGKDIYAHDTISYYSGTGTIRLFGRTAHFSHPKLGHGERLNRDYFARLFRSTAFYKNLRQ